MPTLKPTRKTGILLDFIVVDCAEGGIGTSPHEVHDRDFYSAAWRLARADHFEFAA